jgi:serine/threonine protein kinase
MHTYTYTYVYKRLFMHVFQFVFDVLSDHGGGVEQSIVAVLDMRLEPSKQSKSSDGTDARDGRAVEAALSSSGQPCVVSFSSLQVWSGNFNESRLLGRGRFGMVFSCSVPTSSGGNVQLCIKRLTNEDQAGLVSAALMSSVKREIRVLSTFKHPNIVRLVGYCTEEGVDKLCLLCELGQRGDLRQALLDRAAEMTWQLRVRIALNIVSALNYLHCHIPGKPVFNRDVKSANVVLTGDFVAKLIDHGLAKGVEMEARATGQSTFSGNGSVGTFAYMCPTYTRTGRSTAQSEIYSLGIVLFEIITGRVQGQLDADGAEFFVQDIIDNDGVLQPANRANQWSAECFRSMYDLAARCIALPRDRFKAAVEVLQQLRDVEQRCCVGDNGEVEHFRRMYEELRAKVQAEEQKRQECMRECQICFDTCPVDDGIECRGDKKHFVCRDCLSDQVRVQSGADSRGDFRKYKSSIVCAFCSAPFQDVEVVSRCTAEAYAAYRKACAEVVITVEQERQQAVIAGLRDQLSRLNGREARVQRERLHIVENILTLHCPRVGCGAAILDFEGCFAVTCSTCRCGFCGWCLADCGADAHAHVKQCVCSQPPKRRLLRHSGAVQRGAQTAQSRCRVGLPGKHWGGGGAAVDLI